VCLFDIMSVWSVCVVVVAVCVSADQSDTFGRFFYNRYDEREYTYCFERRASIADDCRVLNDRYDNGRYDSYDRYSVSSRYRDDNYYDSSTAGVYVGKGRFREYGRDAELTCEFPRGQQIISNIVWERAGDSNYRYSTRVDRLGNHMKVQAIGNYGSKLIIKDWRNSDRGEYHCVASRSSSRYSGYRATETVYMVTDFSPYASGYDGYGRNNYNNYDSYFNSRSDYYPVYRSLSLSGTQDRIIDEDKTTN